MAKKPNNKSLVTAVAILLGALVVLSLAIANTKAPSSTLGMQNMGAMMQNMNLGDMGAHMTECHEAMESGDPQKMADVMQKHMSDGHMDGTMEGMMVSGSHEDHHKQ